MTKHPLPHHPSSSRPPRHTSQRLALVGALAFGLSLTACSGGSDAATSTPDDPAVFGAQDSPALAAADVGAAPVPVEAVPYGNAEVDGATTTQSFALLDVTPQQAITDYQQQAEAAGWNTSSGPALEGTTDWSLDLVKDQAFIHATSAPDQNGATELSIQITAPN